MSHFLVMVFGDNVEAQLQPYHEYECTGVEDQYVVQVDKTDEITKAFNDQDQYDSLDKYGREHYGIGMDENGKFFEFTNPNKKWDWWVIGGRWTDWFNQVQGTKSMFDFEELRRKRNEEATELMADLAKLAEGHSDIIAWSDHLKKYDGGSNSAIDLAREDYQNLGFVKATREYMQKNFGPFGPDAGKLLLDPQRYIRQQTEGACVPYAYVIDSKWHQKGEMGWFGMSSDTDDDIDPWNHGFKTLLDSLPEDTKITIVDCHI
jgi:hypothetical protein